MKTFNVGDRVRDLVDGQIGTVESVADYPNSIAIRWPMLSGSSFVMDWHRHDKDEQPSDDFDDIEIVEAES